MRIGSNIICFLMSLGLFGQHLDSFTFLGNKFDEQWKPGSFKFNGDVTIGSNAINSMMYNDFIFRSGFREESTQEFINNKAKKLNFYSNLSLTGEYKVNEKFGVYATSRQMNAYSGSKDISELFLFGNARYEDQKIVSEQLEYIDFTTLGAHHQ